MNKYFRYIYILLIIILIGFVNSGDNPAGKKGESVGYGYGATPVDTEEDDEINFDLVVRELESLVTEDDHETAGDTVISDNIMQHGLGHIISHGYIEQPSDYHTPPEYQSADESPATQYQPTPQDGKYYLIEHDPGKDGKYRLVPITHLEYIPAQNPQLYPEPEPEVPKDTQLEPLLESESPEEEDNFEVTETTVETNESGVQGIFEKDYEPVVSQPESLLTEDETTETTETNEPKHPHHSYKHNRPTPRHGKITETIVKPEPEPMKPEYHKQADTIREKPEHSKICKQITFIKKDEMGNFVEMDNHDFDIDYDVKATIKYSFKTNLEIIYCDGEIVYTHDGTEYPVSLKYNKFIGSFIMQLTTDFLFIRHLNDRWLVKTKKIPDFIKFFTQDDQGNYIELTPEQCNIDITSTGSFKYDVDSLKCTRIEYYNELVWDKKIKRGYPMAICYGPKISFMIYFKGYVCFYDRRNGKFYLRHVRRNRTKGYLDK